MLKSFLSKCLDICSMCLLRLRAVYLLLKSGSWERHMKTESSTYITSFLFMLVPGDVVHLKHIDVVTMDHRIRSSTVISMDGEV